jgi:hypothetical protein
VTGIASNRTAYPVIEAINEVHLAL